MKESNKEIKNQKTGFFYEWIVPIVIAVILAFLINKFVIYKVKIPSESMVPTLNVNDRLFVTRVYNPEKLDRGDIVVFSYDNDYSVKRFIDDKQNKRFIFRPESTDEVFTDYVVSYDNASLLKIHGKVVVYITVLD